MITKSEDKKIILIFRLGSIGDAIFSLPVINTIKNENPNKLIYLISNSPINEKAIPQMSIFENSGIIDKFMNGNNKFKSYFPKFEYTTDNAAMIAMVGYLKFIKNDFSDLEKGAKSKFEF